MTGNQHPTGPTTNLNQRLDVDFALKAAGLGIWEYDPVTGIATWDERCRQLYGIAAGSQIAYQQALDYVHPDDRALISQSVADAFNPLSGGHYDVTYRTVGDDGMLRWVRFIGQVVFTDAGEPQRFAGVAQEVTQQIVTEQSRQQILRSFDQAPFAVAVLTGPALIYQMTNASYCQLVGRTADQLVGKPILKAIPEVEGQGFIELLQEVVRTGIPYVAKQTAFQTHHPSGMKTAYFDFTYQPWQEEDQLVGVMIAATDVTQQVLAQQRSEESQALLRSVIEEAPFAMGLHVGPELRIDLANDTQLSYWGRDQTVLGKPFREVLPELEGQGFFELFEQSYATGQAYQGQAAPAHLSVNGQLGTYYFDYSFKPIRNQQGQVYGVLNTAIDVTTQVLAHQALEQQQARQRFLLQLSDQLRSVSDPLAVYEQTACLIGQFLGASRAGYAEDQGDGDTIVVLRNYVDGVPGLEGRYRYEDYGTELMIQLTAGHTVIRSDIAHDPSLTQAEKAAHAQLQLGATLNKPLMKADQLMAVLFLHFEGPHVFTDHELSVLEETAERTREAVSRARAEAALRASEAKFRLLIQEAPVATMLLRGPNHTIELANERMLQLLGRSASILGQPAVEAVPELSAQPYLHLLNNVYMTGVAYEAKAMPGELLIDGVPTRHYFDFTYKSVHDETGAVYGIISMAVDVTEQILTRQRIEQSQQQLLTLFEQSPVGIAIISEDNLTFRLANPFYGQLVGREPADLVGKPLLEALPEIRGQGFEALLYGVIQTGVPFVATEVAFDIVRQGQLETIYVDLAYQPRREMDGRISAVLVIATDVTQQVRSRQTVEESEQQLRQLIEYSPVAVGLVVGRELVVKRVNDSILTLWGKDRSMIGQPLAEALPELAGQPFLALLDEVYTTGRAYQTAADRTELASDNGLRTYYLAFSYTPLRNAAQQVYAILITATDVTEMVQSRQAVEAVQQELLQASQRLGLAMDAGRLGAYTLDLATGHMDVSPQCRANYGQPAQTPFNFPDLMATVFADDRPRIQQAITVAVETQTIYTAEYRIIWPDGTLHWVRASGQPEYGAGGKAVSIIGVTQDITTQRLMQEELERQVQQRTGQLQASVTDLRRSNENLQQFAYIASHDLQEPLRKIQSFGDLLKTRFAHSVGGEELAYLERMQGAASRMSTLVRDLLSFSRISTGQSGDEAVDLNQVVNEVLGVLDMAIANSGGQVQVTTLPTVSGNAVQLMQLFQNLISNAIKFHRPDATPHVYISSQWVMAANLPPAVNPSRQAEQYVCINVADNGIGFEEKYLDRIFQVFQRLHGKNQYAGTGIGLAICEKVVTNHGGAITARSELGQGATFLIYLPAETYTLR